VEQLIRDGCAEKERLSVELREQLKRITDADAGVKKSSQVIHGDSGDSNSVVVVAP